MSFFEIDASKIDINHGCLDIGVTEESLKAERISTILDEVSCECVSEKVRVNAPLTHPRSCTNAFDDSSHVALVQPSSITRREVRIGIMSIGTCLSPSSECPS